MTKISKIILALENYLSTKHKKNAANKENLE